MRLQELAQALDLVKLTPSRGSAAGNHACDITEGYTSDLLSDILAHAPEGGILVTLQVQPNVIAIAGIAGLRAIIFTLNRVPDGHTIERAAEEGLSLYSTPIDTFDVVGRLYSLGIRGSMRSGRPWKGNAVERKRGKHEREPGSLQSYPEAVWVR